MEDVIMHIVKALSFKCKTCGVPNVNEFDKGDTATRCENCLTVYKINLEE